MADNLPFKIEDVITAAQNGSFLDLIKMYKQLTGSGLKDSKEAIQNCLVNDYDPQKPKIFNLLNIVELFYKASGNDNRFNPNFYSYEYLDKEQFLILLEKAIDHGKYLGCRDMLEAVMTLCNNISRNGGLFALAARRSEFINKI